MMPQRTGRSTWLHIWRFPNYWEETREQLDSGDEAIKRLEQLMVECELGEAVGSAYVIEDNHGNELQVFCSPKEWGVASYPHDGAPTIACEGKSNRGTAPFLIPEWTEIESKYLISPTTGKRIVSQWVDNGTLAVDIKWSS